MILISGPPVQKEDTDMFSTAKWIWLKEDSGEDSYGEFLAHFDAADGEKVRLYVACDGCYTAYLNGKIAAFSSAADFPAYKLADKIELKGLKGKNELKIVVWHFGVASQTYIADGAKVAFEVKRGGKTLCASGENTVSRPNVNYKNNYKKVITAQLGLSFLYDATVVNGLLYEKSRVLAEQPEAHLRPTAPLRLRGRRKVKIERTENGFLVDMKRETVGFLELSLKSPDKQKILVAYGEHLTDGRVPRFIDKRDFSAEYVAAAGKNEYINTFRRIAGRYLEIFCSPGTELLYAGIRPVDYPVQRIGRKFEDKTMRKIYDVSVYTLRQCMHEHYEDCPWREQALYTMDSRNQMLCGYYAFRGARYQRANLVYISKGLRADGLLSLCFPGGLDYPIPFFSLVYPVQVSEYIAHTGDKAILKEVGGVLERIVAVFDSRVEENGLIANFPAPYWNFYEWSEGSSHSDEIGRTEKDGYVRRYDLILNCMYVHARKIYARLTGGTFDEKPALDAIHKAFFDGETGIYRLSTEGKLFSRLGNAFALLVGLGGAALAEKTAKGGGMTDITLSMLTFLYDALLKSGQEYKTFVTEDIKKRYSAMLKKGATTFWETEKGAEDFGGAGSLCHGWSALPVYYLSVLS